MKIKIKENIVGLNYSYCIGEIVDTEKDTAKDLIQAGYAEEVETTKKSSKKVTKKDVDTSEG